MRTAWVLLCVVAVIWLLAASRVPLFPDEMYYWEWSRHLAAGYFDHPPAIAWLIALGTAALGSTAQGVRLLPVACGLAAAVGVGCLARRLAGGVAGSRAVALFVAIPLVTGASVLATPDAPLLATTAWSLVAVVRALDAHRDGESTIGWWLTTGLLVGLSGLAKYMAVLLPVGILVALLTIPALRPFLRSPGPYLAAGVAALVVAPVVLWNAGHDWISFRFQLGHGLGGSPGGSMWERELSLLGGQVLVATPILLGLMAGAVRGALRAGADVRARVVACVAATVAAFFVLSALRKPVEANWLAAAYPPAVVLMAIRPMGEGLRRWARFGVAFGAMGVAVLLLHVATPWLPLPREPRVVANAYGWEAVAAAAAEAAALPGTGRTFVAANRYQEAATMAFHLPGQPTTFALNFRARTNQYDLWPRFPDVACPGDRLVLVSPANSGQERAAVGVLAPVFDEVTVTETVERRLPAHEGEGRGIDSVRIRLFSGWRGAWPPGVNEESAGLRCRS